MIAFTQGQARWHAPALQAPLGSPSIRSSPITFFLEVKKTGQRWMAPLGPSVTTVQKQVLESSGQHRQGSCWMWILSAFAAQEKASRVPPATGEAPSGNRSPQAGVSGWSRARRGEDTTETHQPGRPHPTTPELWSQQHALSQCPVLSWSWDAEDTTSEGNCGVKR